MGFAGLQNNAGEFGAVRRIGEHLGFQASGLVSAAFHAVFINGIVGTVIGIKLHAGQIGINFHHSAASLAGESADFAEALAIERISVVITCASF